MFITANRAASASAPARSAASKEGTTPPAAPDAETTSAAGFSFNIKRLIIAAAFLVVLLLFAIGTAFSVQLAQIHTMLVHAFEFILGLFAGLLGGEVIAKSENG